MDRRFEKIPGAFDRAIYRPVRVIKNNWFNFSTKGHTASLTPKEGVVPDEKDEFQWQSCEGDPRLELKKADVSKLRRGWYMVEIIVATDCGFGTAKLYLDYGHGYSEADSVSFPFFSRRRIKRLYNIKATPRRVRFDPIEHFGRFSVERLTFIRRSRLSVPYRMLRRIRGRYPAYRGLSLVQVWRRLKEEASVNGYRTRDWLHRRYDATFSPITAPTHVNYSEWISKCERPEFSDEAWSRKMRESLGQTPLISVIMPVYNPSTDLLEKTILSVIGQSYDKWELCIADDASPDHQTRQVLTQFAKEDPRIKIVFRAENGHISAASNSALSLAVGEYVAFLDHDDELAPHALLCVAVAINRHPSVQIVYSDEDKIDENGSRSSPHFKSDWNPDLFHAQNYLCHLTVVKRGLLDRIGGFRRGLEGSQDHDLLLRCLPHVAPGEIHHLPKILYHWRIVKGSTALGAAEKTYTSDAGIKALQDYFSSIGREDASVEPGLLPNTYRVRYALPQPQPLISLVIPTKDQLQLVRNCITSILQKTRYPNYEILIIDNQSIEPETLSYFKKIQAEHRCVKVHSYPYPFNFSAINNFAVAKAAGEIVGLINNDIEVISPDWLDEMASHALRSDIGCVGAKLIYPDDSLQHAGVILGIGGVAGHSHKYFLRSEPGYFGRLKIVQNLSAVTGACLLVRKKVYGEVGGFEEKLAIAFNDVDFCLKVHAAGYRNLWTPYAELFHHESKSRGYEDSPEKVKRFNSEIEFMQRKWGPILQADPFYNPNLTLTREDFSLN